jgi:hypothetical protein
MNAPDPLCWTQTHVLGCSGPFRYCTNIDAKLAELAQLTPKFVKRSYVRKFRNERTWSTLLDPKFMFWGVPDRFVMRTSLAWIRPYSYLLFQRWINSISRLNLIHLSNALWFLCILVFRITWLDKVVRANYMKNTEDQRNWLGTKPKSFQCSPPGHHITFGARKGRVQIQHVLDIGFGLQDTTKL